MTWRRAVALVNVYGLECVRFRSRILSIGDRPRSGDTVVDLAGASVLPGLVNAHDHLELNHYGRLRFRDRYENAADWIADMRPRLSQDQSIRRARAWPLAERLFAGALKNLLAGVTTVAHHNPYYRELRRGMPIRVVDRYGWAHSFALEHEPAGARGEPGGSVQDRWRHTPANRPFIVHLAEGTDDAARAELGRLEAEGCLAPNTVLVHSVALDARELGRVAASGAGLVWCPASNQFLLGRTAKVRDFLAASADRHPPRLALGTDSRLTGARDLLDELRVAREAECVSAEELLAMVTVNAAAVLQLPDAGRLSVGLPADFIALPTRGARATSLVEATRATVVLVVVGGRPLVGDVTLLPTFRSRGVASRALRVDGVTKLADARLVRRVAESPIAEPGVSAA